MGEKLKNESRLPKGGGEQQIQQRRVKGKTTQKCKTYKTTKM
jgi:hypothetical protein